MFLRCMHGLIPIYASRRFVPVREQIIETVGCNVPVSANSKLWLCRRIRTDTGPCMPAGTQERFAQSVVTPC